MIFLARKVLSDCRYAMEFLESEEDIKKFGLLWVSCISLLRAVGHVLRKVDGERDPRLKSAIVSWWRDLNNSKNQHSIFFEFIDLERNNILKEYEIGMFAGEVNLGISSTDQSFKLSETLYCPMTYGKFEGDDCRDIANQAIQWWESQLNAIEKFLCSPQAPSSPA